MDFNEVWDTIGVDKTIEREVLTMRMARSHFKTVIATYRSIIRMFRKDVEAMRPADEELIEDAPFNEASALMTSLLSEGDIQRVLLISDQFTNLVRRELKLIEEGRNAKQFVKNQRRIVGKRDLLIQYLEECHDRAAPHVDQMVRKEEKFSETMEGIHMDAMHQAMSLMRAEFNGQRQQLLCSVCDLCFVKNKSAEKKLYSIAEKFESEVNDLRCRILEIQKETHRLLLDENVHCLARKNELTEMENQMVILCKTIAEELSQLEIATAKHSEWMQMQSEQQNVLDEKLTKIQSERDWWFKKVMNAIKSQLHKTVFVPDSEKLHAVVRIIAVDRKKKERFLCIVATMDQPVTVRLYFVKAEKDSKLRKKQSYYLRDIKTIDGINPRKPIADFKIAVNDREFLLTVDNFESKDDFIREMYKLSSKYLPVQRPDFANVPFANVPVDEPTFSSTFETTSDDDIAEHIIDYQPISVREEADFRRLLGKYELKIGDAEKFSKVLNEQLTQLDGANIESIMDNGQAVTDLIDLIDQALEEATNLETMLDHFDDILSFVRDNVELMEEKDILGMVERKNSVRLVNELSSFVKGIDSVSEEHIQVLQRPNLSDPSSISRCCIAARAMHNFLNTKTSLSLMDAYKTQIERLSGISDNFVDTLMAHLSVLFYRLNEMLEGQDWHDLSLPKQSQRFHALSPFADLISWLKQSKPSVYQAAIQRYIEETRKLYARNMKRFFDTLEPKVERISTSDRKAPKGSDNIGRGTIGRASGRVDWADDGYSEYLKLMETVLGELAPVVDSEQKFCTRFFHINSDILTAIETQSTGSGDSGNALIGGRNLEKHLNEKVRDVTSPLFDTLEDHLESFVKTCCSRRATVVFPLFVMLSKRARVNQDASSFFAVMILGRMVVLMKRQFDMLMEREARALEGPKLTKRVRVGVLDTIQRFAGLARCAEKAFSDGSDRRNELDRWYGELVNSLTKGIETVASSSYSKSPPSVVRFENYHNLYLTLSELKIECLDGKRKDAKKQYQENMEVYVKEYMGRPLEKIHLFFEQVQIAIDSGIKPDEISYQSTFTRDELRKVISSYPGKEVKKGLELLYKKVEKHLVDQSPLLQVVWRYMQDEFLKQLKHYQQVIGRCYPNQRVDLEFSINEVLQFFSEIAQQH